MTENVIVRWNKFKVRIGETDPIVALHSQVNLFNLEGLNKDFILSENDLKK